MAKAPNKLMAPIVIAGITVGFLTAAHRFIFAKKKKPSPAQHSAAETARPEASSAPEDPLNQL